MKVECNFPQWKQEAKEKWLTDEDYEKSLRKVFKPCRQCDKPIGKVIICPHET